MKITAPDLRKRELAAIHVAKTQLGLDDGTYRDMLWTVARVRSAADLDFAGRKRVLDHLRARGFHPRHPGKPRNPAPDKKALLGKIEAQLADAGRPWAYGHAMAKHMFALERLEFCEADQLRRIVAALAVDALRREGRA